MMGLCPKHYGGHCIYCMWICDNNDIITVWECVCVCVVCVWFTVLLGEWLCVCVCVRERDSQCWWENGSVCVCVCVREREIHSAAGRMALCVCVCVCVCERERDSQCWWENGSVCDYNGLCVHVSYSETPSQWGKHGPQNSANLP